MTADINLDRLANITDQAGNRGYVFVRQGRPDRITRADRIGRAAFFPADPGGFADGFTDYEHERFFLATPFHL